jgi:hypothetical protein
MSLSDLDEQIEQMRARLEARQETFAELDAGMVDLRRELEDFEREYDSKVGWMDEEIKKLDEEIEQLRHQRAADLYGAADPYANWRFGWTPPEGYVSVAEQYERARHGYTPPAQEGLVDRVRAGASATLEETAAKQLYRKLARRFHPDLAETEADRAHRTEIMAQINEAYTVRSLAKLKALQNLPNKAPAQQQREPPAHIRLQQLEAFYAELETKITSMKRERERLMASSLMDLKIDARVARRQGRDLLAEIAAAARRELEEKQQELERLRHAQG